MSYKHVKIPESGEKITVRDNQLNVPDTPILGYVEGDGIGPDISNASLRVWDAAVAKAYGGKRKIHWCELYLGEKAANLYDGDYFPAETLDAIRDLVVAIKGPLTTPVGGGFRSLNVSLRQELDLYACVRPVRYYDGVPSPLRKPEEVDVVIYRGGDVMTAWLFTLLADKIGLGLAGIGVVIGGTAAVWASIAIWLGKTYKTRASSPVSA